MDDDADPTLTLDRRAPTLPPPRDERLVDVPQWVARLLGVRRRRPSVLHRS
ncbi:MAG: hypothetical protein IT379_16275 [Deltaproteobacteria bacterium]|nr:hypothetical protein [Deltaproteobacteria bacterium]